ncbi:B3 domain-containing protein Os01g0723500 [Selaginella moellendorffii]|nr:B3 domain-containing protein Os01g0723500 [Selaginella moellendorffii]|eukprot:XP_024532284.1 B3 domain-containing protein Os01g0723500 [Selaginella moellendorffii]
MADEREKVWFVRVIHKPVRFSHLSVPRRLAKDQLKKLCNTTVFLQDERGQEWPIATNEHAYFCSGWNRLARDKSLKGGEVILFMHEGRGRLRFKIFAADGADRQDFGTERFCGRPPRIGGRKIVRKPRIVKKPAPKLAVPVCVQAVVKEEVEESGMLGDAEAAVVAMAEEQSPDDHEPAVAMAVEPSPELPHQRESSPPFLERNLRSRPPLVRSKLHLHRLAMDAALAYKSDKPTFIVKIQGDETVLSVRREFAERYLPRKPATTSVVDGESTLWTVKWLGIRACVLGAGWPEFAKHHVLKKLDICLFELITQRAFQVRIYR